MRTRWIAVLAASFAVLVCAASSVAFVVLRGTRAAPASGLSLTYACAEPVAAVDVLLIEARLDEVRASAAVEVIDATHLRLRVGADESSRHLAAAVTMPRVLELMPVDEAAMRALAASPLPAGVTSEGGQGFRVTLSAASRTALSPVLALVPPGDSLVLGCDDPEPGCRGWVVLPSELGNAEVARADASLDDLGGGGASVGLTLTASGAQRFEALTARIAGGRLAIVLDGHAVSVPIVQERIVGGRVMISLGGRSALPEAQAMAAALGAGRLSCSAWTLETEDVFGAGDPAE